jgi:hypothetical protein
MNTIDEKVELNTDLLIEVHRPDENIGSTSRTGLLDRFEDWINFLKDVVKILAE